MTDIDALVDSLTLDEKAALTAGVDDWSTAEVARLGIPAVYLTDGPNGARGTTMGASGPTSVCVPCGTALGATWDPDLVEAVGALVGREARRKSAHVLLAPTVNLHRSPLAGRNFECYSEDPLLSGKLAAGFVRGAQAQGVATTVKHLVGNDAEFERHAISSVIDERALRELYLLPFEIAVREGGALGLMTSYNRLNGSWVTEQRDLLEGIVRDEWGFAGLVVTDWYGFVDTTTSAEAGVDLEMPGPARRFGPALADAVRAGSVDEKALDAQARRLLTVFDRVGALAGPVGVERVEVAEDLPEERALVRRAAGDAMVLLANDGLLPLDRDRLRTVAVLGPNSDRARIMGGGSAALRAHHMTSPLDALRARLGEGVSVIAEPGCRNDRYLPLLRGVATEAPSGAGTGFDLEYHAHPRLGGEVVDSGHSATGELFSLEPPSPLLAKDGWSMRARTRLTPPSSGTYEFGLIQIAGARLLVDGAVVIDGFAERPPRGEAFFGAGSAEVTGTAELEGDRPVDLVVEYATGDAMAVGGWRVGWRKVEGQAPMDDAVAAAAAADVAVVVVGTTGEWESEGHDRTTLDLPGDQDELVRRVIAANPATVVVVNAGSPVAMPWADDAAAVLQVWFGGQEMADALVDVLLGDAEPGGRLPVTLPERLEHNPTYGNFPGENGEVRYGEGLLVGYRWYGARHLPTRHPFGYGLSYTSFEVGAPALSSERFTPGDVLAVEVEVTNTGDRRGAEVVQCYVAPPASPRLARPPRELRAFAKVWLDAGESATVRLELDDRAFAYWDPGQADRPAVQEAMAYLPVGIGRRRREPGWKVDPGTYRVVVARHAEDPGQAVDVEATRPPA